MSPHDIASERVATPLSESTHKIRFRLLVAASTGIVIFHTGLVPAKIEGLGIEFTSAQQGAIVLCLLGLVAFLFVSFLISAAADVVSVRLQRRSKFESAMLAKINEAVEKAKEGDQQADAWYSAKKVVSNISKQLHVSLKAVAFLSRIRLIWDAMLPVVIALYSITVLSIVVWHGVTR
jgi:hypothetical protein